MTVFTVDCQLILWSIKHQKTLKNVQISRTTTWHHHMSGFVRPNIKLATIIRLRYVVNYLIWKSGTMKYLSFLLEKWPHNRWLMNGLIKQWAQHFSSKIYKWADWILKYTCSRTFNKMESVFLSRFSKEKNEVAFLRRYGSTNKSKYNKNKTWNK